MRILLISLVLISLYIPRPMIAAESNEHAKFVQQIEQGLLALFKGNAKGAITAFEKSLEIEPNHFDILHYLGMAYTQDESWNKAVDVFQSSLNLKPDNIEALYSLSIVYFKLNQWENAVKPLQKVITISPQHARGHELLGKVYIKLRLFNEAVEILTKAIKLKPNSAGNYNELGNAYLNLKSYQEAIENFNNAIKFGPKSFAEPYFGIGTAYQRLGDRDKSRQAMLIYQKLQKEFAEFERWTRLTKTDPENLDGWTGLATVLMNQKNYNEVIPVFQKCIEISTRQKINPTRIAGYYQGLSQAFINLKYPKHAQEAIHKAIQLDPKPAIFYNTLGSTYAMLGDVRNAIAAFQKAISIDGEQPYYHLNLSKLYQSIGNHKLAKEHYQAYEHFLSKQK